MPTRSLAAHQALEPHCRYEEGANGAANGDAAADENGGAAAADTGGHDEDRLEDEQQAEFTKVDKRVRTTGGGSTGSVRNLRIREDTAKYLLNLDPKSAHYDPKSRSMRADPNPDKASHEKTFAGDNALRTTGDEFEFWQRVTEHTVLEGEKGSAAHLQARSQLLHVQCLRIAPSASATGVACCCCFGGLCAALRVFERG